MKLYVTAIIFFLTVFLSSQSTSIAQEDLVLAITGEDVSDVVDQFNHSQSVYRVTIRNEKYRNWRYAINQFRFSQKSVAKGSSDQVIDISFIDNNWLPGMIQEGWLEDITGKIPQAQNLISGLAEAATKDGKLYGFPFSNKGQVLFYRKDLHQKHGLKIPQTLHELEDNARYLMKHEGFDHGLTIHFSAIHLDVLPFLWSNGGGIMKNGVVNINNRENIETLTYLQSLAQNGILPGPETFEMLKESYGNAKKLFMEGKSPYIITWNNRITDFENSPIKGKFGILPIPSFSSGQQSFSVIGSWYFGINTFSKHKEGAIQFLNFFSKNATQLGLALDSTSFIPTIKSIYTDSRLTTYNTYLSDLEVAMSYMKHRLKHPQEPEINHVFENNIKEILIENKPVKPLLEIAQKRIISILKQAK